MSGRPGVHTYVQVDWESLTSPCAVVGGGCGHGGPGWSHGDLSDLLAVFGGEAVIQILKITSAI